MSNLSSNFQVLAGWPPHGRSAMEGDFTQKTGESPILTEGMLAKVENASGSPVISKLTSAALAAAPDYPWLVIEGMDQSDAAFTKSVACLATKSGLIFKVDSAISVAVGDLVYANAGVIAKVTGDKQAIGQVIGVNAAGGYVIIACAS